MQDLRDRDLKVMGIENGALIAISDDGERFRIPIDEVLQSRLRQSTPDPGVGRKLSPREIQSHIRSGMSAADVSAITGVPIDYIQKFEGPVLAEREFVLETALGVAVHASAESQEPGASTFGVAIRSRLHILGAINEHWASWKDTDSGWVVKLSYTADQIDHDARWSFDPRKLTLSPLNAAATTLSQQGDAPSGLIPRLRAVSGTGQADSSRFDSGAFDLGDSTAAAPAPVAPVSRFAPEATTSNDHNQTADLLDALRRRRGEREAAAYIDDEAVAAHPSTGSIRLVDVPLTDYARADVSGSDFADSRDEPNATSPQPTQPQPSVAKPRKGRASMPSWDDIVFGARTDDDLA
jgi:hypothetical protein